MSRWGEHAVDCCRGDDRRCGGGWDRLLSVPAVTAGGDSEPIAKNLTSIVIKQGFYIFIQNFYNKKNLVI